MSEELVQQRAHEEAQALVLPLLNIFGGADGGISFIQLKSNLEGLYAEYQRNPTHQMTTALNKIQDAFLVIEKLSG